MSVARRMFAIAAFLALLPAAAFAQEGEGPLTNDQPKGITPDQIIQKFAEKEREFKLARDNYTFRQDVKVQTLASLRQRGVLPIGEPVLDAWAVALEHDQDELLHRLDDPHVPVGPDGTMVRSIDAVIEECQSVARWPVDGLTLRSTRLALVSELRAFRSSARDPMHSVLFRADCVVVAV